MKNVERRFELTLTALAFAVSILVSGCGNSDQSDNDKMAAIQHSLSNQADIVSKSGGNWKNLSSSDQQALINGPGAGSADTAKQYLAQSYARDHATDLSGPASPESRTPPTTVPNNTPTAAQ